MQLLAFITLRSSIVSLSVTIFQQHSASSDQSVALAALLHGIFSAYALSNVHFIAVNYFTVAFVTQY